MKYESICFFLTSGRTFTFRDVKVVQDNETEITIHYIAMSDGKTKAARFSKHHVVGIAYCEEQKTYTSPRLNVGLRDRAVDDRVGP